MGKDRYQNLNAGDAARFAKAERKLLQQKWAEINDANGIWREIGGHKDDAAHVTSATAAVFYKGMKTLTDLTLAHSKRQKPGFFARLFNATKEAREYNAERAQINGYIKNLKKMQKEFDGSVISDIKKTDFSFDVFKKFDEHEFFTVSTQVNRAYNSAIEEVRNAGTIRNKNSTVDAKLMDFLRDYDRKTKDAAEQINPEMKTLFNTTQEKTTEFVYGGSITYEPIEADFINWKEGTLSQELADYAKEEVFSSDKEIVDETAPVIGQQEAVPTTAEPAQEANI